MSEDFTRWMQQHVPALLADMKIPGIAVATIEGSVPGFAGGFGLADTATQRPVTKSTKFQLASISKSVTSWGLMKLVEQGRLDLDAPVENYLTRWHLPPSRFDHSLVTAARLMSHTAGISLPGFKGYNPRHPEPTLEQILQGEVPPLDEFQVKYSKDWNEEPDIDRERVPVHVEYPPGEKSIYSGGGYTILELLIEELSGTTFTEFMQAEILDPLGMRDSSFAYRQNSSPEFATPYNEEGVALPKYRLSARAAGGLNSTVVDLAKFACAEMSGPDGEAPGRGISFRRVDPPAHHAGDVFGDHRRHRFSCGARTFRDGRRRPETRAPYRGQYRLAHGVRDSARTPRRLLCADQQHTGQRSVDGAAESLGAKTGAIMSFAAQLEKQVPGMLARHGLPGAAVGLVEDGVPALFRCWGHADMLSGTPICEDTLFNVASVSKAVSSWGVMKLCERGLLELDAPVERYLQRWHLPPSQYNHDLVTARRLLSHTAGINIEGINGVLDDAPYSTVDALAGRLPPTDDNQRAYHRESGIDPDTARAPASVKFPPGAAFHYSNAGFVILQLLIEELSGMAFPEYMQREILAPLGMDSATFVPLDASNPRFATAYRKNGGISPVYRNVAFAAGGLQCSIVDLARFAAAELEHSLQMPAGRGVLLPSSLATLFEKQVFAETLDGIDFYAAPGHFLIEMPGMTLVHHTGGVSGWRSVYVVIPETRRGLCVLINSDAGNEFWIELLKEWVGAGD